MLEEDLQYSIQQAIEAISLLAKPQARAFIERVSTMIADCYRDGGKILIAGNGGSLCDAMHFAEELTGFYREKRMALPAIAISDPGHLTCVGNDIGFQYVFSRYIEALGKERDIFICLTTSGRSENIQLAIEAARKKGLSTVAFLGKTGGNAKGQCDAEWIVEGFAHSDRIQEAHMAAIHIIIEMVEKKLFSEDILLSASHAKSQASFN
jgi:D-sedoheptulose 7-phosphate isomerase